MKKLSLIICILISQLSFGIELNLVLTVLDQVYQEDPKAFQGAKIGIEKSDNGKTISQENIVAELERDLEFDAGFCEYKTETNFQANMKIINESLFPRAARIFRKLRNEEFISHISSRSISFQKTGEDCAKKQIRIVLTDGSLIWLDF